jgi:hypothetical protein
MLQDQKSSSAFRSGILSSLGEPDPMRSVASSIDRSQAWIGAGAVDAVLSPVPATDSSAPSEASHRPKGKVDARLCVPATDSRGAWRRPEGEVHARLVMDLTVPSHEQQCAGSFAPKQLPFSISERREEPELLSLASARGAADVVQQACHACQEKATIEILQSRIEAMKVDIQRDQCQLDEVKASYMCTCGARTLQALLRRKRDRIAFLEVRLRLRRYLARQNRQNQK